MLERRNLVLICGTLVVYVDSAGHNLLFNPATRTLPEFHACHTTRFWAILRLIHEKR